MNYEAETRKRITRLLTFANCIRNYEVDKNKKSSLNDLCLLINDVHSSFEEFAKTFDMLISINKKLEEDAKLNRR